MKYKAILIFFFTAAFLYNLFAADYTNNSDMNWYVGEYIGMNSTFTQLKDKKIFLLEDNVTFISSIVEPFYPFGFDFGIYSDIFSLQIFFELITDVYKTGFFNFGLSADFLKWKINRNIAIYFTGQTSITFCTQSENILLNTAVCSGSLNGFGIGIGLGLDWFFPDWFLVGIEAGITSCLYSSMTVRSNNFVREIKLPTKDRFSIDGIYLQIQLKQLLLFINK